MEESRQEIVVIEDRKHEDTMEEFNRDSGKVDNESKPVESEIHKEINTE